MEYSNIINFPITNDVKLNATHYLIMYIYNKRELQKLLLIIRYESTDIDYTHYIIHIHKIHTTKPYSILTINATLPTDDTLHYRGNLLVSLQNDTN